MKPLCFLDCESTGLDVATDRIISIGLVCNGEAKHRLVNPGRSIPAEITKLTGITDAMVADQPKFAAIAKPTTRSPMPRPRQTYSMGRCGRIRTSRG